MNGGIYFFKRKLFKYITKKTSSLENEILPKIIKKRLINGKIYKNFFIDIGTPKNLEKTEKKLKEKFTKPAVFLDRDGVINYDYGYVNKIKDFRFKKGVISGLKYIIKKKYFLFIVTNQAGIAKGKFKEEKFIKLQLYLKSELSKKKIFFDDVQYCPYHSKGTIKKYRRKTNLRKPGNKMVHNIFKKYLILKKKSFMIGDNLSDKLCAEKSNLNFFYAKVNFDSQIKKIIKTLQ